MWRQLKSYFSPPSPLEAKTTVSVEEGIAMDRNGEERIRDLFNRMNTASEVIAWFKREEVDFFHEWPRGRTLLFRAANAARACRFADELEEFVACVEAYWYKPNGTNPFTSSFCAIGGPRDA